jgi:hypothetical protein
VFLLRLIEKGVQECRREVRGKVQGGWRRRIGSELNDCQTVMKRSMTVQGWMERRG